MIWTDLVRNEEELHRVKEARNILQTIKRRKSNCTGHILRRNCLLTDVTKGKGEKTEVTARRRRKRKQPLDDVNK